MWRFLHPVGLYKITTVTFKTESLKETLPSKILVRTNAFQDMRISAVCSRIKLLQVVLNSA